LQDLCPGPLGQAQHVDHAVHRCLGRLDRIMLVMHRRSGTGEVVDLVHLDMQRKRDVVADRLEIGLRKKRRDQRPASGEIVVGTEHVMSFGHQPRTQMTADEPRASRHEDAFLRVEHAACSGHSRNPGQVERKGLDDSGLLSGPRC
jgi:hypothetical protein